MILKFKPNLIRCVAITVMVFSVSGCTSMKKFSMPWAAKESAEPEPEKVDQRDETLGSFERARDQAMLDAADARWRSNDIRGCENTLLSLLSRNPEHVEAQLMLADLYAETNRLDQAQDQLETLLEDAPNSADAYHALAVVFEQMGKTHEAIALYQKAAALEPNNEAFKLSYEIAVKTAATPQSGRVVLASAEFPVIEELTEDGKLGLRFNDSEDESSPVDYPRTSNADEGVEDRVEQLKHAVAELPEDDSTEVEKAIYRLPE